jgi:hypothetical protein
MCRALNVAANTAETRVAHTNTRVRWVLNTVDTWNVTVFSHPAVSAVETNWEVASFNKGADASTKTIVWTIWDVASAAFPTIVTRANLRDIVAFSIATAVLVVYRWTASDLTVVAKVTIVSAIVKDGASALSTIA